MSTSLTKAMMLVAASTVVTGISPAFAHETGQQHSHSSVSYVEYEGKDQDKSRYEYRINNKELTTDADGNKVSTYTTGQRELRGQRHYFYSPYRYNQTFFGVQSYGRRNYSDAFPVGVVRGNYDYIEFRDHPESRYRQRKDMAVSFDFGGGEVTGTAQTPIRDNNKVVIETQYPGKHGKCDNDEPHSHTFTPR